MTDDGLEQEDQFQYVKKEFLDAITPATVGGTSATPRQTSSASANKSSGLFSLPHNNNHRPWYQRHADADYSDNDSNFFMSEPSMSEADSSDQPPRLLESPYLPGDDLQESLLFFGVDPDEADDDPNADVLQPPSPPPPPPPPHPPHVSRGRQIYSNNHVLMAPHSPGNTSLSSWDTSPHPMQRVQVHFSPTRSSDGESKFSHNGRSRSAYNIPSLDPPSHTNGNPDNQERVKTPERLPTNTDRQNRKESDPQQFQGQDRYYASNSTSPASEGRMQQLEEFLDDLRVNSQGKVHESSSLLDSNTSFESSFLQGMTTGVQDVLRKQPAGITNDEKNLQVHHLHTEERTHARLSSMDTTVVQNTCSVLNLAETTAVPSLDDNTLMMILSDSGDEVHEVKNEERDVRDSDSKLPESVLDVNATSSVEAVRGGSDDNKGQHGSSPDPMTNEKNEHFQPNNSLQELEEPTKPQKEKNELFERSGFLRQKGRKNKNVTSNNENGEAPTIPTKSAAKPKHRRQRSGDAAAATIATGSGHWKGMELDRIPIPEDGGDETDTTADTRKKQANGGRRSSGSKPPINKTRGTIDRREEYGQRKSRQNSATGNESSGISLNKIDSVRSENASKTLPPSMSSQANEIAAFSQFALGIANDRDPTSPRSRPRRVKQRSFRTIRRAHLRNEEDDHSIPSPSLPNQTFEHLYNSPSLSGYMASPSSRKTFSPPPTEQWQRNSLYNFHAAPLGSSWNSASTMNLSLPAYLPTYRHYRSYSEIPFQSQPILFPSPVPPPPPPPLQEQESSSTSLKNGNFRFQMPDRSAPIFASDNQLLQQHHSPFLASRQAHSFEYSPTRSQDDNSPFAFVRRSPDTDDNQDQSDEDDDQLEFERNINHLHNAHYPERVLCQNKSIASPFFTSERKEPIKFTRNRFLLDSRHGIDDADGCEYPTYICPVCNTRQREFFTVSSAPRQFEGPGGFIALYFAIYVVGSLYIFGLQEGWGKLDCIYFAVITLTTAGLGDFVPTTDGAKIICSIFIYFGVACIGLLLGSYIAGMLDERSHREAVANQIKACPNCARIQNMKDAAERRRQAIPRYLQSVHAMSDHVNPDEAPIGRATKKMRQSPPTFASERLPSKPTEMSTPKSTLTKKPDLQSFVSPSSERPHIESTFTQNHLLDSPMTSQILGRQNHTRHISMDFGGSMSSFVSANSAYSPSGNSRRVRNFSMDIPATVEEGMQVKDEEALQSMPEESDERQEQGQSVLSRVNSCGTFSEEISERTTESGNVFSDDNDELEEEFNGIKIAKYVFLTLREALINSMVIIAFGCLGFCLIEGFSVVDSWYFTTVLLTTVGYGDISPVTEGGKLFATIYLLVAGTILLNNMSMISMIPLELRKRRTEQAVLTQFGDSLDDEALRELATGPVVQRINLASHDSRGLDECTREMFALAMLIRLGKVTEQDIKLTFAAFRRLDVNNEGVLNSQAIIHGMIRRHASKLNLANLANPKRNGSSRSKGQHSTRSAASNLSWSSMGAWIGASPASGEALSDGKSCHMPTPSFATSESTPLVFGPGWETMYGGNPVLIPTRE